MFRGRGVYTKCAGDGVYIPNVQRKGCALCLLYEPVMGLQKPLKVFFKVKVQVHLSTTQPIQDILLQSL